jgi:hypothetical protein
MEDGQVCHHLLPTSIKHGIERYLATLTNPDTMTALISDTLVSRMEPPPSERTDVMLEQTFQYWNRCHSSRITRLIMQGMYMVQV